MNNRKEIKTFSNFISNFQILIKKVFTIYALAILIGVLLAIYVFRLYQNNIKSNFELELESKAIQAYNDQRYSESISLFNQVVSLNPSDKNAYLYLAKLYFYKGLNSEAVKNFEEFIELGGELDKESYSIYVRLLIEQDSPKALELWSKKDLSDKVDEKTKYLVAQLYLENSDVESYKKILYKIQDFQEPFLDLQVFEKDINVLNSNLSLLSNKPSLGVKNYDIDTYRGLIKAAKEKLDQNNFEHANLNKYTAFVNLKKCRFVLDEINSLKAEFQKKNLAIYQLDFLIGKCANDRNDWSEAIPLIQNAIQWDKSNVEYREELAYSYFLAKDQSKVRSIYEDIITINKSSRIYENYAFYLFEFNDKKEALEKLIQAFKLSVDSSSQSRLAKNILRVSILELNDANICMNTEYDNYLDIEDKESKVLKFICYIVRKQDINQILDGGLVSEYFKALKDKKYADIPKILDKDITGIIVKYNEKIKALNLQ